MSEPGSDSCHAFNQFVKVGMTGFEPATSCTPCKRATGLRHIPKFLVWKGSKCKRLFMKIHLSCAQILQLRMNILLRKVIIADSQSTYNGIVKDVFIQNGIVTSIEDNNSEAADTIIEGNGNLYLSPGFVDVFAQFDDPGFEHKETLVSGAAAASAGGYTTVFTVPNTSPVVSNKSGVEYIVQKSKGLPVNIRPLGAITKNCEGKELAEMYDMYQSGAVAFTDGLQPVQSSEIMLKALQYVKAFNGVIVQMPVDKTINTGGLMHEGIISTQLGLPGIPSIGEELIIQRDIRLLQYTESRLHITGVSTAQGIELIKEAKRNGLNITCSVTPYHLYFCDEDLQSYDTNLKVNPPLRSKEDREALRNAVIDGTVDCIASHHIPQHWDDKVCEFEYARNGMLGLQTSFAIINTLFPQLPVERLTALFSDNARKIFNLPLLSVRENSNAQFTMFSRDADFVLTKENLQSKSANTPFLNMALKGKVKAIKALFTSY